ncbi:MULTISPECIES: hypothetical protein [unclassified Streptomyces]|uniref:hypothetical protein n=1 Tax=unclassified Streptomyces TaxID=2593676 RepID=UPI000940090E|nr:hypothetical protein [Streptomyces sp. CB01580]
MDGQRQAGAPAQQGQAVEAARVVEVSVAEHALEATDIDAETLGDTAGPSGDARVSNSSVLLAFPLWTVTRAEKPCSARSPARAPPLANCRAAVRPAPG